MVDVDERSAASLAVRHHARGDALRSLLLAAALIAPAGLALAQGPASAPARTSAKADVGPTWQSLSPAQRQSLAPLERDWSHLQAFQKLKWIELAKRLPGMPADQRERIQARMTEWARMTPAERGQARLRFEQARRAAPGDRSKSWEDYQALPIDQKEELAARAALPARAAASSNRKPTDRVGKADGKSAERSNVAGGQGPKPVAPIVMQARPGATTTLMSKQPAPPPHQQTGLPKIAASPGFVDRATLLPQLGAQGAAAVSVSASDADAAPVPRP